MSFIDNSRLNREAFSKLKAEAYQDYERRIDQAESLIGQIRELKGCTPTDYKPEKQKIKYKYYDTLIAYEVEARNIKKNLLDFRDDFYKKENFFSWEFDKMLLDQENLNLKKIGNDIELRMKSFRKNALNYELGKLKLKKELSMTLINGIETYTNAAILAISSGTIKSGDIDVGRATNDVGFAIPEYSIKKAMLDLGRDKLENTEFCKSIDSQISNLERLIFYSKQLKGCMLWRFSYRKTVDELRLLILAAKALASSLSGKIKDEDKLRLRDIGENLKELFDTVSPAEENDIENVINSRVILLKNKFETNTEKAKFLEQRFFDYIDKLKPTRRFKFIESLFNSKQIKTTEYAKKQVDCIPIFLLVNKRDYKKGKNVLQIRRDGAVDRVMNSTNDQNIGMLVEDRRFKMLSIFIEILDKISVKPKSIQFEESKENDESADLQQINESTIKLNYENLSVDLLLSFFLSEIVNKIRERNKTLNLSALDSISPEMLFIGESVHALLISFLAFNIDVNFSSDLDKKLNIDTNIKQRIFDSNSSVSPQFFAKFKQALTTNLASSSSEVVELIPDDNSESAVNFENNLENESEVDSESDSESESEVDSERDSESEAEADSENDSEGESRVNFENTLESDLENDIPLELDPSKSSENEAPENEFNADNLPLTENDSEGNVSSELENPELTKPDSETPVTELQIPHVMTQSPESSACSRRHIWNKGDSPDTVIQIDDIVQEKPMENPSPTLSSCALGFFSSKDQLSATFDRAMLGLLNSVGNSFLQRFVSVFSSLCHYAASYYNSKEAKPEEPKLPTKGP